MRFTGEKRHPAVKHGGYAATTVLPGESVADFEKLHKDVIADMRPSGPIEADIVADTARLLWRKQHMDIFEEAKFARALYLQAFERERQHSKWYRDRDFGPDPYTFPDDHVERPVETPDNLDERLEELDGLNDIVRKEIGEDRFNLAMIEPTLDGLLNALDVRERLDAAIEKCLKRLLFVRGLKSVSASPSLTPLKRVAGPPRAA